MKLPAISVIIPMFNAEEFIGECLESVSAQTFQDFEVIVVDDCSTDKSVAIVESYAAKFVGRLRLAKTKKNSGGGGYLPRNLGLKLSRGEYIFFMDADDVIVKNAFEILIAAAENFKADVVYVSRYYSCGGNGEFNLISDNVALFEQEKGIDEEPVLTINAPNKNLQLLLFKSASHTPWTKFVRRDFLIEHEIEFPNIISGGDFIWTIQVFHYAKRFLRLPIAFYFYREDVFHSLTRKKLDPNEQISRCAEAFWLGAKALYDLSNKIDLLKQNKVYFRAALLPFFFNCLGRTFEERMQLKAQDIYEILHRKFVENDLSDLTMPFLFSVIDEQQKELLAAQRHIDKLEKELKTKE